MPRREAVGRSMTRETARPPGCSSVATSSRSGNCFRRETKRLVQSLSSLGSDRKSTRLNSSHQIISYAVFCLKKKKNKNKHTTRIHNASHQSYDYITHTM